MAGAYSTFARDGIAIKPSVLRRIENNKGVVLKSFNETKTRVFPPEPVAELIDVLQDVVKYGTGTQAKLADRPVAGKTGTADEGKDIWFIGFTPDLVTAVWGGNDDNLPIPGHNVTGGVVMAKIWQTYNKAYYDTFHTPPGSFTTYDKKLAQLKYNSVSEKQEKENVAANPNNPVKEGNAEFLQPKVERIDETKEVPVVETIPTNEPKPTERLPGTRLVPEQSSAQINKPVVEPTVELVTPLPAPAEVRTKTKSLMPTSAPQIVRSSPSTSQTTLSAQTPSLSPPTLPTITPLQAPSQGMMSAPNPSNPNPHRLIPYQQKSIYRPAQ
jgi:membrane peptidoglycan carboxypeptidase